MASKLFSVFCAIFLVHAIFSGRNSYPLALGSSISESPRNSAALRIKMENPSAKLDARISLKVPSLEELAETLQETLSENFQNVSVEIVDCPDLTGEPFFLAAKGIGGNPQITEVGGPGNLFPVIRKTIYNLYDVCETSNARNCFAIGAGAGPLQFLGFNSEIVHNAKIMENSSQSKIESYVTYTREPSSESQKPYTVRKLTNETIGEFSLMGNFFLSEGKPDKVLKVVASRRTGENNFVTQMQTGLTRKYGQEPVGLGGVFQIKSGKVKMHVMPELPSQPFQNKDAIGLWLKYFDMDAPLNCISVIVSHDPGLDLRLEHTHCYSNHGDGGHYHYDISPDQVHYEGYFAPAKFLTRIDRMPQ